MNQRDYFQVGVKLIGLFSNFLFPTPFPSVAPD